ncbi:MAG: hypothetical protein ABSC37_22010 [Xanthobacteraceae bacterium]
MTSHLKYHPKHAEKLGYIVDTCATIEKVCCEIVAGLLKVSDEKAVAVIYAVQSSRSRFGIVEALTRGFALETIKKRTLQEIVTAHTLFKRRNDLVHNMWISRRDKPRIYRAKAKPKARERAVSLRELDLLLTDLENCLDRLTSLSMIARA